MASVKAIMDKNGKQRKNKNGLLVYRMWVSNGFKNDGTPKVTTKTLYAKSKKDAERQANAYEIDIKRGISAESLDGCTLPELIQRYRNEFFINQREKTIDRYNGFINNQILPYFGHVKIKDIRPDMVQNFISYLGKDGVRADKKSGGYSSKTIKDTIVLLRSMFEVAIDWELITRNPCKRVRLPKNDKKEADCYTKADINKLLEAFKKEECELEESFEVSKKYKKMETQERMRRQNLQRLRLKMFKLYVLIALNTGARRSEMTGLEFDDIKYDEHSITFKRTSQHIQGEGIKEYDTLKNGNRSKCVTISAHLVDLIKEYKENLDRIRLENNWQMSDKIFISIKGGALNPAGGPINPDNVSQWWERFLAKYQLPKITLHQIRHTNISITLDAGIPLTVVAQRAGHNDQSITLNRYGHAMDETEKQAANIFDDVFTEYISPQNGDK